MNDGSWQANVKSLFLPESVALVGASPSDPMRLGILRNFGAAGYAGKVYPVNPRYEEIEGLTCYPSLDALPEVPESVILAIGAERVPGALHQAADLGVRSAIVLTGGFADVDEAGAALQRELADYAASRGVALLGPNCQGTISFAERAAQYLLPMADEYVPGSLGLIAQSGSVTDALTNNQLGVGWSHVVSTGNEAVVTAAETLAFLVEQDSCRGVVLFLESIRRPEVFFTACDRARELGKPVIVLKSGRTAKAQKAALAHTGALATPERLVDAAFAAHGVIRVANMEEALAAAAIVQAGRVPRSNKISVVLGSGGLVELLHDAGEGIDLPDFGEETKEALKDCVGPWIRRQNPLDYWPTDNVHVNLPLMIHAVARDDNADSLVEIQQFHMHPTGGEEFSANYGGRLVDVAGSTDKALIMVAPVAGEQPSPEAVREAAAKEVAIISGLGAAVGAISSIAAAGKGRGAHVNELAEAEAIASLLEGEPGGFSGAAALDVMKHAGLQLADYVAVKSSEDAVREATRIGFPVTVKIADRHVLHKTEVGGVRVGLASPEDVSQAAEELLAAGFEELLVQQMVGGAFHELIVGLQTDPALGRFVLVGLGGVWTEILDDAVAGLVGHIDRDVATGMVERLKGYETLLGARGGVRAHLDGVVDTILALDALASRFPQLRSIDVNPLMVTTDAAWVVDALIETE